MLDMINGISTIFGKIVDIPLVYSSNQLDQLFSFTVINDPVAQFMEDIAKYGYSVGLDFYNYSHTFFTLYLDKVRENGFGIYLINDLFILISLIRFLLLSLRYNALTGLYITLSSCVAGYLWYSEFIHAIMGYANVLGEFNFGATLASDGIFHAKQVGNIVERDGFLIMSNPFGIIGHALGKGGFENGYCIDPISLTMSKLLTTEFDESKGPGRFIIARVMNVDRWNLKNRILLPNYYLCYRHLFPILLRIIKYLKKALMGLVPYTLVTRVYRKYCPYIIRWHWCMKILTSYLQRYPPHFFGRVAHYSQHVLEPRIELAESMNLHFSQSYIELALLKGFFAAFLILNFGFYSLAMLHALCGQYFYIPILTDNVELHVGKRLKTSIYSGGFTSWQDDSERRKGWGKLFPKVWFGWFGKGTTRTHFTIVLINKLIYKPIYKMVKKLLRYLEDRRQYYLDYPIYIRPPRFIRKFLRTKKMKRLNKRIKNFKLMLNEFKNFVNKLFHKIIKKLKDSIKRKSNPEDDI